MQPEVIEIGEVEDVMVGQEDKGRSNVRKMLKYFALSKFYLSLSWADLKYLASLQYSNYIILYYIILAL